MMMIMIMMESRQAGGDLISNNSNHTDYRLADYLDSPRRRQDTCEHLSDTR